MTNDDEKGHKKFSIKKNPGLLMWTAEALQLS